MNPKLALAALTAALLFCATLSDARDRPAPPPSRYGYVLKFDAKSLPAGVTIRELSDDLGTRFFIKNTGEMPLVIDQRFDNGRLVGGAKLVSGKVYHYFPNGVPMEGKQHLKGWQAPFGDIPETLIHLAAEPAKIYEGRKPGLSKDIPAAEAAVIPATYDGKPHEIKVTIHYHLNKAYDAHYAEQDAKRDPKP